MTSRVANVYAAIIIPVPAATLALALRFKARRMTRMGTGYDDVFAVAAWVSHPPSSLIPRHRRH
jgi:hypothetical protein